MMSPGIDHPDERTVTSVKPNSTGEPMLLVVEPSGLIAHAIERDAARLGLRAVSATDFASAAAVLVEQRPVAVVSSCQLAGLPGRSLYAAMQACSGHRAIPFALITAEATGADADAPFPVFIKSPGIGGEIRSWLGSLGLARGGLEKETPLDGVRLLVAEDTASMRRLLAHRLHLAGAVVTLASDGVEAGVLGLGGNYDLILLDIEMPRLDGRDAIRLLRDAGVRTPIAALTAHDDATTVHSLIADSGFDGVIGKGDAINGIVGFRRERDRVRAAG
jgi:DNA-binding response OmpR family regulator